MSKAIPYIVNANSLSVFVEGRSFVVTATNKLFNLILDAIKIKDWDAVTGFVKIKDLIVLRSQGKVSLAENALYYNGVQVHHSLTNRVMDMFAEGFDIDPLLRFIDNLMQNPSQSAIDELYDFLACSSLPITEDGHFLAYKMIRNDYKDIFSGSMDNSVGTVVTVPRSAVDDNRNRTCSSGLHFASLNYVENGGYGKGDRGDRLVVLKINPRDVVSIPVDYNNSKGRACEYLILEEIEWTDRITDLYVNLSASSVVASDDESEYDESDWDWEDDSDDEVQEDETPLPARTLDDETVRNIRKALKQGWTLTETADHFGTSRRTVGRIRDREAYTNVK